MSQIFLALFTAHLLGDFIFQTQWMVERKRHHSVMALHVAAVTTTSYILLGAFDWRILLIIASTHLAVDAIKVHCLKDSLAPFVGDQLVHVAILVGLAYYFPRAAEATWWVTSLGAEKVKWYSAVLSCVAGVVLCVPAGGRLIAKLIEPFADEIRDDEIKGLMRGGQYIGWLERSLVMMFILIDQPTSIGFLIAAKSILRFGEIKDTSQRKVAEYIIIGTFLSFGWAILVAVLTQRTIKHWIS